VSERTLGGTPLAKEFTPLTHSQMLNSSTA
jgi:hypothetical protein